MKLSKSKVNSYLKCPREFKFQYIDEIEVEPNKYMALGSDVHLVAEKFIEKFGDELEDVDINNELLKISHEENIGYDLAEHVDNLGSFFKEVFIDNDYKLYSNEEYLIDEENRFSGICDIILEDEYWGEKTWEKADHQNQIHFQNIEENYAITSYLLKMFMKSQYPRLEYFLQKMGV